MNQEAVHAAKALQSLGYPTLDCLAGHGEIVSIEDAEILYYRQSWWMKLLRRPKTPWCVEMQYTCTGNGSPFKSVGRVYYQ